MRTLIIEYGAGAGDFERSASGFDVVDEYGQRCHGLCLGEMLEQVVGLVVQGRARYQMLTPEAWDERRAAMTACMKDSAAEDRLRNEAALPTLQRLYRVFVAMSAPDEQQRPTDDEITSALAEAGRVIDRATEVPF